MSIELLLDWFGQSNKFPKKIKMKFRDIQQMSPHCPKNVFSSSSRGHLGMLRDAQIRSFGGVGVEHSRDVLGTNICRLGGVFIVIITFLIFIVSFRILMNSMICFTSAISILSLIRNQYIFTFAIEVCCYAERKWEGSSSNIPIHIFRKFSNTSASKNVLL